MSDELAGTITPLDDRVGVVRMEDVYDTDPADLWDAITDPARLARWLAVVDGDLRRGGIVTAGFRSDWRGRIRIDECEPERHLLVTSGLDEDEPTIMEATLTPEGTRTRLVIEERGLPIENLPAHGAGWQVHVEDLSTYLAGGTPGSWEQRWRELIPGYRG